MAKARQNLVRRVARLERAICIASTKDEEDRLFAERRRLQERRGIVAVPPPIGEGKP